MKYQRSTTSNCKDNGIRKYEFGTKTHFLLNNFIGVSCTNPSIVSTNSQNTWICAFLSFKNFTKLLCFVHDTPIKWYTICQSLYKAAIVLHKLSVYASLKLFDHVEISRNKKVSGGCKSQIFVIED